MMTEEEEESSTLLAELITSLEEATEMAKKLPNTTDPNQVTRIHSTLHSAHHSLSLFLAHHSLRLPPPPFRSDNDDDDVDDDMDEDVEYVETSMRACFIQNKRPKRQLSPETVAAVEEEKVRRRVAAAEEVEEVFDPVGSKLRALDLIHQFHG